MDVLSSLWALIKEPFFSLSVSASFGNTIVEYIDEEVLEDLRKKEGKNGVGLLTLVSGFFAAVTVAAILGYAVYTNALADLIIPESAMNKALLAGAIEALWIIPYLQATNRVGVMSAAPLFQTIPIFSFILGYFVFEEKLVTMHVVASIVIIIGAVVLSVNRKTLKLDYRTIGQMLLASFGIAWVYSLLKDGALESNFMAALFWSGIGTALMSLFIWMVYKPFRDEFNAFICSPNKKLVIFQVLNEGVNAASATASHYAALKAPSVMVATALNAFHPVFILLFGWVLGRNGSKRHKDALGAGEGIKKGIAIMLIVCGTALIALT